VPQLQFFFHFPFFCWKGRGEKVSLFLFPFSSFFSLPFSPSLFPSDYSHMHVVAPWVLFFFKFK